MEAPVRRLVDDMDSVQRPDAVRAALEEVRDAGAREVRLVARVAVGADDGIAAVDVARVAEARVLGVAQGQDVEGDRPRDAPVRLHLEGAYVLHMVKPSILFTITRTIYIYIYIYICIHLHNHM